MSLGLSHFSRPLITSVTYRPDLKAFIFATGPMVAESVGGSVNRCLLCTLLLILSAVSFAGQSPSSASSDAIFWWQAADVSKPRIERLAQQNNLSCRAVINCQSKPSSHSTQSHVTAQKS